MLVQIYILLIILGFFSLILSIFLGSIFRSRDTEDKRHVVSGLIFILVAGICFMIVALSSLYITQDFCENQVTQEIVSGNQTTYTNSIDCTTQVNSQQDLAYFWYGMLLVCFVLFFYYGLMVFK